MTASLCLLSPGAITFIPLSLLSNNRFSLLLYTQLSTFARICDLLQHAQSQLLVADTLTELQGSATSSEMPGNTVEIYVRDKQ